MGGRSSSRSPLRSNKTTQSQRATWVTRTQIQAPVERQAAAAHAHLSAWSPSHRLKGRGTSWPGIGEYLGRTVAPRRPELRPPPPPRPGPPARPMPVPLPPREPPRPPGPPCPSGCRGAGLKWSMPPCGGGPPRCCGGGGGPPQCGGGGGPPQPRSNPPPGGGPPGTWPPPGGACGKKVGGASWRRGSSRCHVSGLGKGGREGIKIRNE